VIVLNARVAGQGAKHTSLQQYNIVTKTELLRCFNIISFAALQKEIKLKHLSSSVLFTMLYCCKLVRFAP
jgi:hypothetical protein